jgi:hypothetical protein
VSGGSFTKLPNALLFDTDVSLGARLAYALLNHLLWEVGGEPGEEVGMPTMAELASRLGCSVTALKGYLQELRDTGWIGTRRVAHQRLAYVVRIVPVPNGAESDSASALGRIPPLQARVKKEGKDNAKTEGGKPPPPPLVRVDGRNAPLDALLSVCRIDERSPRVREAVAALQGSGRQEGIRDLFWEEVLRQARARGIADGALAERAAAEPTAFPVALAARIAEKAALYRKQMSWRRLTPGSLQKEWLDLELQPERSDGGMTPEEIIAWGQGKR